AELPPADVSTRSEPAHAEPTESTESTESSAAGEKRFWASPLEYHADLGLFGATGYAPRMSFGPVVGFAIGSDRLQLGVQAFYGFETSATKGAQNAEFSVLGGRLRPCYRAPIGKGASARACTSFEVAGVFAEG